MKSTQTLFIYIGLYMFIWSSFPLRMSMFCAIERRETEGEREGTEGEIVR